MRDAKGFGRFENGMTVTLAPYVSADLCEEAYKSLQNQKASELAIVDCLWRQFSVLRTRTNNMRNSCDTKNAPAIGRVYFSCRKKARSCRIKYKYKNAGAKQTRHANPKGKE